MAWEREWQVEPIDEPWRQQLFGTPPKAVGNSDEDHEYQGWRAVWGVKCEPTAQTPAAREG
jgi:hypothetical protein